jgi:hypothetical protein
MKAIENTFPEFQGILAGGEPDIDGEKNRRRHQVWKAWHPAYHPPHLLYGRQTSFDATGQQRTSFLYKSET